MVTRLVYLFLFFSSLSCFSQKGIINGVVVDSKGVAIIGASVIYKGDITAGAVTDNKVGTVYHFPLVRLN